MKGREASILVFGFCFVSFVFLLKSLQYDPDQFRGVNEGGNRGV